MSNFKALILGLLLLVPILILVFVGVFGEHHFTLPYFRPQVDAAGQVQYTAEGDTIFQTAPNFSLTSKQGETFSQADLEGDIYVTHFFSTDCPPACRKITSQLVRVQEAFETNPEVKIVSITVAPETDSLEALQDYAAHYGAKEGKWFFLTGDKQAIYRLATEWYELPVSQEPKKPFTYSDKLWLTDKEGKIRGIYNGVEQSETDRLRTEINVLLDEYSKRK